MPAFPGCLVEAINKVGGSVQAFHECHERGTVLGRSVFAHSQIPEHPNLGAAAIHVVHPMNRGQGGVFPKVFFQSAKD